MVDALLKLLPAFVAALLSFAAAAYWFHRLARKEAAGKLAAATALQNDRIVELERQLAVMRAEAQPISAAFQAMLIKKLTHLHTPVLDALLVKLGPPLTLTTDEELRLTEALKQRVVDLDAEIDELERDAATMLPLVMKRVRAEQELATDSSTIGDLQIVIVPPDHE